MGEERAFHRTMVDVFDRAKREAGYTATRFIQMVGEIGGLATAQRLLNAPAVSDGFTALWERGPLDLTVEAVILRDEYHELFSDHEREIAQSRLAEYGSPPPPASASPSGGSDGRMEPDRDKRAIVEAILRVASDRVPAEAVPPTLTDDPAANEFVLTDPFAFLVGVIFDQQINFERAWAAPFELNRRLGHLDPARLVLDPDAVRKAVKDPPALHRYVENVPRWVVAAAKRVLDDYQGEARRIWGDEPTAEELQARLRAFDGIGQKKAAMAVEILERDLRVRIRAMEGSDIAYDIHVRRVLLRTGLAEYDDPNHMLQVARALKPDRPGALDEPAWRIGRLWCHAGVPDCPTCPLAAVCPKLIDRARTVISV
jgi:uncharacterized HhH-GPD family protein